MSTIPNFSGIELGAPLPPADSAEQFEAIQEAGTHTEGWQTPEHILVPPLFDESAYAGLDFLNTRPGIPPFLRGPYATMYVNQPWTIRQYAGFSTA